MVSEDTTIYAGYTLGWDTGFDKFFERDFITNARLDNGGSNLLAGISTALSDDVQFTYAVTAGDFGVRGDGYSHSVVLDFQLSDKWNYVLQNDVMDAFVPFAGGGRNNEVGINQYLFYQLNDCWRLGTRLEWWKSDAGFNHGGQSLPLGGSVSYYEATVGANYSPHANLTIRPELRHDWFPHANYSRSIFAIDAVVTF